MARTQTAKPRPLPAAAEPVETADLCRQRPGRDVTYTFDRHEKLHQTIVPHRLVPTLLNQPDLPGHPGQTVQVPIKHPATVVAQRHAVLQPGLPLLRPAIERRHLTMIAQQSGEAESNPLALTHQCLAITHHRAQPAATARV